MRGVPLAVIAVQLGHLLPGYVAETVRAAFGKLGIVEPSKVVPINILR
jgi:hypothetical protein